MKTLIHTTLIALLMVSAASAKRLAPVQVQPIVTEKAVYSAPQLAFLGHPDKRKLQEAHENGDKAALLKSLQKGGVIEARDPKTNELLWQVQVYKTAYEPGLEQDIQDVFITSLTLKKDRNVLVVTDEKSRVFEVDLTSKKVTKIK